ncbi:MAG: acetyl-CoA C-acetyltransferase [Halieaceae bacterium]|jgi:acetyl-CoA C-acetyltransferase
MEDRTPVIVGVGQITDHPDSPNFLGSSPQELAAAAARCALTDSGAADTLLPLIDALAIVRTTADSVPDFAYPFFAPLGGSDNMPHSVAKRVGCDPRVAVYSSACGDEPQKLLSELSERIYDGELRAALLGGAEAVASQRLLQKAQPPIDWNESVAGDFEDRGKGIDFMLNETMTLHQAQTPLDSYPLFEHARRARKSMDKAAYALEMGQLFERFAAVAADNPLAMSRQALSAQEIATLSEKNRMVADPYSKAMVARDRVNQGAAILLTSLGVAKGLGIADRCVYLHGYSAVQERLLLERQDLGASPAMTAAYRDALDAAGIAAGDVARFDLYSCFPIAVFCAMEALGIDVDDPRPLTVTGGLPYFGGPGNNYSMHGIAAMVDACRAAPGSYGVVGANGGFLSKHAVGVYSSSPKAFVPCRSDAAQAEIDSLLAPPLEAHPQGWARIETYTVTYAGSAPKAVVVIGRMQDSGARFVANVDLEDEDTLAFFVSGDPLPYRMYAGSFEFGNRLALSPESLQQRYASPATAGNTAA